MVSLYEDPDGALFWSVDGETGVREVDPQPGDALRIALQWESLVSRLRHEPMTDAVEIAVLEGRTLRVVGTPTPAAARFLGPDLAPDPRSP